MDPEIFATNAPAYWKANYSVVPVEPRSKKPPITNWSGYCNNLPGQNKREQWLDDFGSYGIGLLLGGETQRGFRIAAVDIDRDELANPTKALLQSPSGKRGKKGVTLFVRIPAGEKLKSCKIPGCGGDAGDFLFNNKMTVLPPSIHPDTGAPYEFVGSPLLNVRFDQLPVLDQRLYSVLCRVCTSEHVQQLQTGEGTHEATLRLVAQLMSAGATDDEIDRVVRACFPVIYSGDTLDQLVEMIRSAREKGFDKPEASDDEKTIAVQLMDACEQSGLELFHWRDAAYVSIPTPEGGCLTFPLRSYGAARNLRYIWWRNTGKSVSQMALSDAIATLESKALFDCPKISVWNRVGELNGEIYVDLGRKDGQVVRVRNDGWLVCFDKRVKFCRPSGSNELPLPVKQGDLRALQELLRLPDETYLALVGFLISSLSPKGPYFGLMIEGEQGSGKSFLTSVLRSLIDPNDADRLRLPDNCRDLAIHAQTYRLLSYDNTSGLKPEVSDALCVVATGGGIATRKLYTDAELEVVSASRPVMLNGISGFAKRPDLLERSIYIHLDSMPPENRKTEEAMREEFDAQQPAILGALYSVLAHVLAHIEETPTPTGIRMADAAKRIAAAEGALDVSPGELIEIISRSQDVLMIERINDDPLTIAFRQILVGGTFDGLVGELFDRMRIHQCVNMPRSAAALSSAIERQKPGLLKVGIKVEFCGRSSAGKRVRVERLVLDDESPTGSDHRWGSAF